MVVVVDRWVDGHVALLLGSFFVESHDLGIGSEGLVFVDLNRNFFHPFLGGQLEDKADNDRCKSIENGGPESLAIEFSGAEHPGEGKSSFGGGI